MYFKPNKCEVMLDERSNYLKGRYLKGLDGQGCKSTAP